MRDPHKAVVYVTLRLRTTPLSIHTGALQSWKKSTINEQLHCISCSWVQFIQPRDWHITFSWVCLTIAAFQSKWSIFHSSGYSRGLQADFIILILLTKKKNKKKKMLWKYLSMQSPKSTGIYIGMNYRGKKDCISLHQSVLHWPFQPQSGISLLIAGFSLHALKSRIPTDLNPFCLSPKMDYTS